MNENNGENNSTRTLTGAEQLAERKKKIGQCLRRLYDLHDWKYPTVEDADRKISAALIVLGIVPTDQIQPLFVQVLSAPKAKSKFGTLMEAVRDEYAKQRDAAYIPKEWVPYRTEKALPADPEAAARAEEQRKQTQLIGIRTMLHEMGGWPKCHCGQLCDSDSDGKSWFCWMDSCDFKQSRTEPVVPLAYGSTAPATDAGVTNEPAPMPKNRRGNMSMEEMRAKARTHPNEFSPEVLAVLLAPVPPQYRTEEEPEPVEYRFIEEEAHT